MGMNTISSSKPKEPQDPLRPVLVWDLPTRLFHWLTASLVVVSFVTGKTGGNWMGYHMLSGYVLFGLLLFRFAWGFLGGRHARFLMFLHAPTTVLRYAKSLLDRNAPGCLGHNPLGGWSVLAMLVTLLLQAASGLFANDDIFIEGPLYLWVSKATSDWLTRIHKLNQNVIIFLVAMHLAAICFYLVFKRQNLITPMITGYKQWRGHAVPSKEKPRLAILLAAAIAVAVYLLVGL
jgi:cytochrome b